jgi:hypothetical protein
VICCVVGSVRKRFHFATSAAVSAVAAAVEDDCEELLLVLVVLGRCLRVIGSSSIRLSRSPTGPVIVVIVVIVLVFGIYNE